jgi:hypothetical protein
MRTTRLGMMRQKSLVLEHSRSATVGRESRLVVLCEGKEAGILPLL